MNSADTPDPSSARRTVECIQVVDSPPFDWRAGRRPPPWRPVRSAGARTVAALERQARSALGPPSSAAGEPTPAHLGDGLLATYVATPLFTDFRADHHRD